jgi:glycosyltransferase involved in cell wall biosynthesis
VRLFGAVGRLTEVKDHRTLLKAFALVVRERPELRLELLGDGPLRAELAALCHELRLTGSVRLPGETIDVTGFLARTDVFVHSSITEALPMTLLEAMASGLPVAATAVGGVPEIVEGAGCGWLCPPSQPGRLAEIMLRAADSDQGAEMAARGRAFVTDRCSVEKMTREYAGIYGEALEARRRN